MDMHECAYNQIAVYAATQSSVSCLEGPILKNANYTFPFP